MNIFVLDENPEIAAKMLCDKHNKLTHSNHPCSLWARQSKGNFCWLIEYGKELCKEYTWQYKRKHKLEEVINWCDSNKGLLIFRSTDMQPFTQALPDRYKCSGPIQAYREYYLKEKIRFAKWEKGREAPDWIIYPQLLHRGSYDQEDIRFLFSMHLYITTS